MSQSTAHFVSEGSSGFASDGQGTHWSPEQMVRLAFEWRELQRGYAFHPHVRIIPLEGDPPYEYQFEYRIRTLAINGDGQLDYVTSASVRVRLPPEFPHAAPIVKPVEAFFHPNVDAESVQVIPAWEPNSTLVDLVASLGALLSFQTYDPYNVWNPVAMEWVAANEGYVPTDPGAKFNLEAGGDPLERICRSGAASLKSLRAQVQQFCESMLEPGRPPSAHDARYFALRTRLAASMFLANEIPEHLSGPASALDEWAMEIPQAQGTFDAYRELKAAAAAARTAAGELADISRALGQQLAALDAMVAVEPLTDPAKALRQLPAAVDLQRSQGEMRTVLRGAEQKLQAAKARLNPLAFPQRGGTLCAPLETLFGTALAGLETSVAAARQRIDAARAKIEPMIARARQEVAALDRILLWREYADMKDSASPLVAQLAKWGTAGTQAYFVANPGGEHGPFDFEQPLELGTAKIAVRTLGRRSMEAIDSTLGMSLAKTETGELLISLPGEEPGEMFPTTFKLTARCDDLIVQLDYLVGQTRGLLERIGAKPLPAASWTGKFIAILAKPEVLSKVHADHVKLSTHWQHLSADLEALGPLKERMATYHLLMRASEAVPRYHKERDAAETRRTRANERIAEILSRSARNVETDQSIIPGKFIKEYGAMIEQRDTAAVEIKRLGRAIKLVTAHLQSRLESTSTTGSADVPQFAALRALPEDLLALANEMNDDVVKGLVAKLSSDLKMELTVNLPAPVVRPQEPAMAPQVEASDGGSPDEAGRPPEFASFEGPASTADFVSIEPSASHELVADEPDNGGDQGGEDEVAGDWPTE